MKGTGQKGIFLQPSTYGRNEAGQYLIQLFEGTPNEAAVFAAQLDRDGFLYDVRESFGKAQVYARLESNPLAVEAPVSLWELFPQSAEKDLLFSIVPSGITSNITLKQIALINRATTAQTDETSSTPWPENAEHGKIVAESFDDGVGDAAAAFQLYNLLGCGVRGVASSAPALRHTQTVSRNWTVPASLINVGRVLSTGTLQTFESVPSGLLFNLPTDAPLATLSGAALAYGWLKSFPTVQQIAMRRWQIVQEWQYGLWSTIIYGSPL